MAENIHKCEEDDPNRCTARTKHGQCNNKAAEECTVCMVHGGNAQIQSQDKQSLRNYQLTRFQARLEKHATSPVLKSLRDEVAILRMMLEDRLNQCQDTTDLLLWSGPIGELVLKIDKVVNSCHKLEASMGQHLDKNQLLAFATNVISIVSNNVPDVKTLESISNQILAELTDEAE